MRQKLTELMAEIDSFIIIFGEFNTTVSILQRTTRQISKETENFTHNKPTRYNTHTQNTLCNNRIHIFSSPHGTFSRIDYKLFHQSSLNKFKKIDIIQNVFANYMG